MRAGAGVFAVRDNGVGFDMDFAGLRPEGASGLRSATAGYRSASPDTRAALRARSRFTSAIASYPESSPAGLTSTSSPATRSVVPIACAISAVDPNLLP